MAKADIQNLLKRRMAATQQASDLAVTDQVYHKLFEAVPLSTPSTISDLPLEKLVPFQTAEIGFRPYPPAQLEALSQQLQEDGLMVRIIVRPRSDGTYEILAGHNRTNAARLAGWSTIPAEIVEADDAHATNGHARYKISLQEWIKQNNGKHRHDCSSSTHGNRCDSRTCGITTRSSTAALLHD